jgi:very-long-chain (3R)-3-hydroxyacyl-CoA dehydratase
MIGLVKTPLSPTVAQLSSRLFLTWGVCNQIPEISQHWSFTSMIVTWSLSEIVRFGYHVRPKGFMRWMRYNAFIVLFPCGIVSEMMLTYVSAKQVKETRYPLYLGIMAISLFAYGPGKKKGVNELCSKC